MEHCDKHGAYSVFCAECDLDTLSPMTPDPTPAASGRLTEDAQAVAKFLLNSGATGAVFEAQGRLLDAVDAGSSIISDVDRLREAEIAAFIAGATAVHENYQEDRDPDFSEAAHDYAARTRPSPPSPAQVAGSEAALWRDHDRRNGTSEPIPACGEEMESLSDTLDRLPPGPWKVWSSCSFRRITGPDGKDGGVLSGIKQRSDGHPDLSMSEDQLNDLCAVINRLRAYLSARPPVTTDAGAVARRMADLRTAWCDADNAYGRRAVFEDAMNLLARLSRAQADGGEN